MFVSNINNLLPDLQTLPLKNTALVCRFDVGPILQQELYEVPPRCTADELGQTLAVVGARLVRADINLQGLMYKYQ